METDNLQSQPIWHGLADVPARVSLRRLRESRVLPIAELGDEAPADLEELERMAMWQTWGPILALPGGRVPAHVEFGACLHPDWEATGMIRFRRRR